MSALWISAEQAMELLSCTTRHLRRLGLDGRDSSTRGRNGKPSREFRLASLPAEARAKYLTNLDGKSRSRSEEHIQTAAPECAPTGITPSPLAIAPLAPRDSAVPAACAVAVQVTPSPERVALPPAAESEAMRRIAILKPLIDYLRDPKTQPAFENSNHLVASLAAQHSLSAGTIWRWKAKFDKAGRFGLARKPRTDKNCSRWAADNRELADLAALIYIGTPEQPAQSVRVAWEAVCERAQMRGIAEPSYETVRAFLRNPSEVSPSLVKYGREGRKKYDEQFAPYMSRGYTEPANSIWVSDHCIHDVLVQNDVFGARDLKHMRLQMTTLLDYRSRFVCGVSWCENGSSHSIKRALLRAFTQYGLPDRFYCDNGKDYRKVAKGARPRDLELLAEAARACRAEVTDLSTGVMQRLGIPVTFCLPYHPQSKHIERYHRTMHERFDKRFTTYTAGATHLRPDAAASALAKHGKLLQMNRAAESSLPLASEFIAMCEWWIENEYHLRPQPDSKGMDGRSPAEVFASERPAVQRPCPEIAVLAMLLCERETRKVMNCAVEISGARFVPAAEDYGASVQMHERSGRRVTVAFDPLEPMYVAVLDEDLRFLCRLQREDLMRFSDDEATRGQVQSFIANRNALRKAVRESTAAHGRRVRAAGGFITLEDQLRERAALPSVASVTPSGRVPVEDAGFKHVHSEDNVDRYFQQMEAANGTL